MPFSRGSSRPRDWTGVSCIAGRFLTIWATKCQNLVKMNKRSCWDNRQKRPFKEFGVTEVYPRAGKIPGCRPKLQEPSVGLADTSLPLSCGYAHARAHTHTHTHTHTRTHTHGLKQSLSCPSVQNPLTSHLPVGGTHRKSFFQRWTSP